MSRFIFIILLLPYISYAELTEKQLVNLYREVKCLVCTAQSIAESNAEPAVILKEFIKDKAGKGATENEIKLLLVDRFGPEILFSPPNESFYKLLWAFPYLLLCIIASIFYYKKNLLKTNNP